MNLLKSKRFYCVLALLAAPATLKALSDYYYTIVYYGSIGTSNYLAGSRTLGVGTNHIIPYYCSDSAAIGSVLNVQYPNSVVVGKYNQTTVFNIRIETFRAKSIRRFRRVDDWTGGPPS